MLYELSYSTTEQVPSCETITHNISPLFIIQADIPFFLWVFFHCHAIKKKRLRPAAVVHRCHFQWLEGRREAVPNPPPPRLWLPSLASQRFSPRPFKEIKETTGKAGNMKNLNSKHNKWKGWFGNMITLFLFKWSLKHWNSRMKFCWLATYCQDATALKNMQQARLTHASKPGN